MKKVFLTDSEISTNLFPFTETRPACDIRVGILTIREKWEALLGGPVYLKEESEEVPADANIVSANIIPSKDFVNSLLHSEHAEPDWELVKVIQFPWHIFQWNDWAIRQDFALLTRDRISAPLPATVHGINADQIFIEPGASLSYCILNAEAGPIYIGRNSTVMEGSVIRGPFALCEGAVVKMGSKIYGATTIGPKCVVGGEIKNSVIFGYSNKAHEGYLGDSVIGEWCNLGAGTSNSNMKNNAGSIKLYNHELGALVDSGLNKCGLMMGDYSRAAINTSFNTGTIVGVCVNIVGQGLAPKYLPSFSWGFPPERYSFTNALQDISNWKKLKDGELSDPERTRLKLIFDQNSPSK